MVPAPAPTERSVYPVPEVTAVGAEAALLPYAADGHATLMSDEMTPAVLEYWLTLRYASWPALWNCKQIGDGFGVLAGPAARVGFCK